MDASEVKKMKVTELRTELENRGLDSSGLKQALVERLEAALAPAVNKTTPASPAVAPASTADPASKPPATAAAAPATNSNHTPIEFKPSADGTSAEMTELQKKAARAKRFGIQLTEAEQKAIRAERFGNAKSGSLPPPGKTASGSLAAAGTAKPIEAKKSAILATTTPMDEDTKKAELEKRKERAKRFELPVTSIDEEQAKKKARAERFGTEPAKADAAAAKPATAANGKALSSKANGKPVVKVVVSEEEAEKRKARALRFATGLPPAKEASSGTTAEQVKKLEDRAIRFGTGKVGEAAAVPAVQAQPSAQA